MENDIKHLIEVASAAHLKAFLVDYAQRNDGFRRELEAFLMGKYVSVNKKSIDDYCRQMQRAFKFTEDIGDRWHSCVIPDWGHIMRKADSILKEGSKLLEIGNANVAASIAVEFFVGLQDTYDEDVNNYDYEGDIACGISDCCEEAEKLLLNATRHPEINKDILHTLTRKLNDISKSSLPYDLGNYDIFDFDGMLLQVTEIAMSDEDRLSMLDTQIEQHAGKYDQHVYVERKSDLLRQLHREDEAWAVLRKFINLPPIRTLIINDLISKEDYSTAVQLVNDGIDLARELNHGGTVRSWNEKKLEIYEHAGDLQRQIDMSILLFVGEGGSMNYYHKLKALVPAKEWKKFLNQLLDKISIRDSFMFGHSVIADIYVEEKDADKLFELVMSHGIKDLECLNRYAVHTGQRYAKQLLEVYSQLLKQEAQMNVNVKSYSRIAEAMACMCRLYGGKPAAHQLADFFRREYHRRPKMMESISKY